MSIVVVSYRKHHFPPPIIARAAWLYFCFPLSLRVSAKMLLKRGIVVSLASGERIFARSIGMRSKPPHWLPFRLLWNISLVQWKMVMKQIWCL